MRLRKKIPIVIGMVFIISFAILSIALREIVLSAFAREGEQETLECAHQVQLALENELTDLEDINADWAIWDDTYKFLKGENPDYVRANLETTYGYVNNRVNVLVLIKSNGEVMWKSAYTPELELDAPFPEELLGDLRLESPLLRETKKSGLLRLSNHTAVISAHPVLTSEGEGLSTGWLVFGRYLDAALVKRICLNSRLVFDVYPLDESQADQGIGRAVTRLIDARPSDILIQNAGDTFFGYSLIRDIYGKPVAAQRTVVNRDIYAQGKVTTAYFMLALMVFGVALMSVTLYVLEKYILVPVSRLDSSVGEIGGETTVARHIIMPGNNELSHLAASINGMLDRIEEVGRRVTESQERFRRLVENAPVGIALISADGRMMEYNRAVCEMYGYASREDFGRIPAAEHWYNPADYEPFIGRLVEGPVKNQEIRMRRLDGSDFWTVITTVSQPPYPEDKSYIAIIQDITEQKHAVELIRGLARFPEESPHPVMRVSRAGELMYANAASQQLISHWDSVTDAHLPDEVQQTVNEAVAGGVDLELEIKAGERAFAITITPVVGEDYVDLYGMDITQRKQADEKNHELLQKLTLFNLELEQKVGERTHDLELAAQSAEAANRSKSEFLSNMSHELRTPLSAVIGFSQLLQEEFYGPLNENQRQYVQDILESGHHLLSLINDILDLAKVEAGRMELETSEMDIRELVDGALRMIKEKAQAHGLKLEQRINPPHGNLLIMADRLRLKQVLLNLLSNAAKFTPDGGKITVEAELSSSALTISVRDTGIGIEPEDQKRLFQTFVQLDSELAKKAPGTGLGLVITKRFVEMHGGKIWFASEGRGKGTCFTFAIPRRDVPPAGENNKKIEELIMEGRR